MKGTKASTKALTSQDCFDLTGSSCGKLLILVSLNGMRESSDGLIDTFLFLDFDVKIESRLRN